MIGCDPIVTASRERCRACARAAPTRRSTRPARRPPPSSTTRTGSSRARSSQQDIAEACRRRTTSSSSTPTSIATALLGDSISTNPLMLGYAWQKGRVPLADAALMRAIELNGVQVDNNKAAFEWGRAPRTTCRRW